MEVFIKLYPKTKVQKCVYLVCISNVLTDLPFLKSTMVLSLIPSLYLSSFNVPFLSVNRSIVPPEQSTGDESILMESENKKWN